MLRLQSSGPPEISKLASLSLGALIAQGAVGYLQYFTGVPAALVELHVLGSVVVFSALLWTHLSLFTHTTDTIDLTDLDASRQSAVR
ncbi:MAG: hypothetical protein R2710_03845 [Acidimicrobiales bacterium]